MIYYTLLAREGDGGPAGGARRHGAPLGAEGYHALMCISTMQCYVLQCYSHNRI